MAWSGPLRRRGNGIEVANFSLIDQLPRRSLACH